MSTNNKVEKHPLLQEFAKIQTEDELNECAKKLRNHFQTLRGLSHIKNLNLTDVPKKNPNRQKKFKVNTSNKHEIQGLYRSQEHRAVQEILFGPSLICEINQEKIEKHYSKKLSVKPDCKISLLSPELWKNDVSPSENNDSRLTKNFNPAEVRSKLNLKIYSKLSKSRSVGLDMLRFTDLKKYDPDLSLLTAFFNACLKIQKIPKIWKEFYSVLVKDKKGDDEDIKNWKTVTMQNTTSKLFQALIAARLIVWAKETNRLSSTQKGYLQNNAACESSFILQECKKYALKNNQELAVAWLDFSSASDSVPQEAVHYALEHHAVPETYKNLILSVIKENQTCIRLNNQTGYSNKIPILKGLPQGSPLDPILIDLVVEPILRKLKANRNNGFQIYNQKVNHFAIPNEISLIAESKEELQNLLKTVEETAKLIGLQFDIDKCSTYNCDKNGKVQESKFTFFCQKLSTLSDENLSEYFGVRQGLSIGQPGIPTIREMLENIEYITISLLESFQKLDAVQSFIMPRVENCLRGIQKFDENSFKNVETILKDKIKMWLKLPSDASTASIVFHAAKIHKRNDKILPFRDLFYIMKIVQAFKMLTSEDKVVQEIAVASLKTEVTEMIKDQTVEVTMQLVAKYLSGDLPIKTVNDTQDWLTVRQATQKVNEKMYLKWAFENNKMQLKIKNLNDSKVTSLTDTIHFNVDDRLKTQMVLYYIEETRKANPEISDADTPSLKKVESASKKPTNSKKKNHPRKAFKGRRNQIPRLPAVNKPLFVPHFLHTSNFPVFNPQ